MRKFTLVVAVALWALLIGLSNAADKGTFELGVGAGAALPGDDLGKVATSGAGLDVSAGLRVLRTLVIGVEAGRSRLGTKPELLPPVAGVSASHALSHTVGFAKLYTSSDPTAAYFRLGVGAFKYALTMAYNGREGGREFSQFGVLVGGGIHFGVTENLGFELDASTCGFTIKDNFSNSALFSQIQIGGRLTVQIGN